jgi:hypothetical protein
MREKKCSKCGIIKPLTDFSIRTKKDSRPRPSCKICVAEYAKQTTKNKYNYGKAVLIRLKSMKGCKACGYKVHHAALEFNHINRKDKLFCISSRVVNLYCKKGTRTKETFRAELNKCEILCSNCHSILSFEGKHYSPIEVKHQEMEVTQ